jgi:hypothetical protein
MVSGAGMVVIPLKRFTLSKEVPGLLRKRF